MTNTGNTRNHRYRRRPKVDSAQPANENASTSSARPRHRPFKRESGIGAPRTTETNPENRQHWSCGQDTHEAQHTVMTTETVLETETTDQPDPVDQLDPKENGLPFLVSLLKFFLKPVFTAVLGPDHIFSDSFVPPETEGEIVLWIFSIAAHLFGALMTSVSILSNEFTAHMMLFLWALFYSWLGFGLLFMPPKVRVMAVTIFTTCVLFMSLTLIPLVLWHLWYYHRHSNFLTFFKRLP